MKLKLIRNDFAKSRFITLVTTLFVAAAALLVSLAAILAVNLTGTIDTLMREAQTPHFMQMHSGDIAMWELADFAAQSELVDEFQVSEFLNIDNAKIQLGGNSLAHNTQDNGFSVPSGSFDYLLDLDGEVIDPTDGELYVPLCYMRDGTARVGDTAVVSGKQFAVAGFLRDSQMNTMLSSSKRFLISKNDYARLAGLGDVEYLIEFRLKDISMLGRFEADYVAAGLPANGPAITYPLFRLLNAMSDGIMIGVILLVSLIVVVIALLCIRFTLLTKIEEDYREIGVMKAIGLRVSDIRSLYLAKYAAIGVVGCALGFALSFVFSDALTESIRLAMGESGNAAVGVLLGLVGVLCVLGVILLFVSGVLRRFHRISAAEAISFGAAAGKRSRARGWSLCNSSLVNTNVFLGVKDVMSRKGLYATMLATLVLAAFIIIVPQNLYSTLSADDFLTYMGIGNADLRIDLQQTDAIPQKAAKIEVAMKSDSRITGCTVLTTKTFGARTADGLVERIKVELGDHSVFPVAYAKGGAPTGADQIALSSMNAAALGKRVGDTITLVTSGGDKQLTVCGIYSDITNGGKTAKAAFTDSSAEIMWSVIYASFGNKAAVGSAVRDYSVGFDYAKVTDTQAYVLQTYGQTLGAVRQASVAAIATAIVILLLVTLIFVRLLIAKDSYSIAVMKASGFTNSDIRLQYLSRTAFVLIVGVILGTILANTLGEAAAGVAISALGAASFRFTVNPLAAYLVCPLMVALPVLAATMLGTGGAGAVKISRTIKE